MYRFLLCVCPMNYVNDHGIPFFPTPSAREGRKRDEEKKILGVREMPPPHFFLFLTAASEQPFMLAVWARVSGSAAMRKDGGGR